MIRSVRLSALAALLATGVAAPPVRADRVTVKGTVLEGTVKSITSKEIVLETVYGKGDLVIKTEDVEAIATDVPFHVFHGADVDSAGSVVGLTPEAITVSTEGGSPTPVPFDEVYIARRDPGPDANLLEEAAIDLAYWTGNFDFLFSSVNSTNDTNALVVAGGLFRERGPSRFRVRSGFNWATAKDQGEDRSTTASEIFGELRQEYDLAKRFFAFGSFYGEHDGVEEIDFRLIPRAGFGYRIYESETAWFSVDAGPGFVWENYENGGRNRYTTLGFGAESDWKLPWYGASWNNRLDWSPAIGGPFDDFLLRYETALLVPLIEQLSFKASVIDLYNNSPAEDAEKNNLTTLVGLSLGF